MMPELGLAIFRIAMFLVFLSAVLLFVIPFGSVSFYVNILALLIGLFLMGVVAALVRRFR